VVRESVDLEELTGECLATVREIVKGKGVTLTSHLDDAAKRVYTDSLKIRQILLNLLSNAAKFTDSGEVVVEARAVGSQLVIGVEDTGIGIRPISSRFVFDKFRQVDGFEHAARGGDRPRARDRPRAVARARRRDGGHQRHGARVQVHRHAPRRDPTRAPSPAALTAWTTWPTRR